jgi:DNA-binding NarL/FixJ family response regulator
MTREDAPGPVRVLVALDEPLLREGVARILEETPDLRAADLVGGSRALEDAFATEPHTFDVAVVDVAYQREDPGLLARLHERRPHVAVLIFVDHDEGECILRSAVHRTSSWILSDGAIARADECCLLALRHHALGCIPRTADRSRVVESVRAVAEGRVAAQEWALARWLKERRPGQGPDAPARITPRELEVIQLVADGRSNKAIARELGVKEQTVKNHLGRIMRKLGAENRVEVALMAREHNLTR